MKLKHLLILSIILGVLILGVCVKELQTPPELAEDVYASLKLDLDPASITQIEIQKGPAENPLEILRENDGWRIPVLWNARADGKKIQEFLGKVAKLKGELRTGDTTLLEDFGIRDEEAYKIYFKDDQGAVKQMLLAGIKRPGPESVFLRRQDSAEVYLTDTDLFSEIGIYGDPAANEAPADFWADLNLVPFPSADIEGVQIIHVDGDKETTAAHIGRASGGDWKFANAAVTEPLDPVKVQEYMASLSSWRAQKVLDPAGTNYGLDKPTWKMILQLAGGKIVTLVRGAEDPVTKDFFIQISGEPVIFLASQYYLEEIDAANDRFFRVTDARNTEQGKDKQEEISSPSQTT